MEYDTYPLLFFTWKTLTFVRVDCSIHFHQNVCYLFDLFDLHDSGLVILHVVTFLADRGETLRLKHFSKQDGGTRLVFFLNNNNTSFLTLKASSTMV